LKQISSKCKSKKLLIFYDLLIHKSISKLQKFYKFAFRSFVNLHPGTHWSITAYNDWQESPILTTLVNPALSIDAIEFPAVTICSPGMNEDIFKVWILPTFYLVLFCTKVFCAIFLHLQFVLAFLVKKSRQKNICNTVKLGYNEQLGTGQICSL